MDRVRHTFEHKMKDDMDQGFFKTMGRIFTYSISAGVLFVLLTLAFKGFGKIETVPYMMIVAASFLISVLLIWPSILLVCFRNKGS